MALETTNATVGLLRIDWDNGSQKSRIENAALTIDRIGGEVHMVISRSGSV